MSLRNIASFLLVILGILLVLIGVSYYWPRHQAAVAQGLAEEASTALQLKDLLNAENRTRRAIKLVPLDPEYHSLLGRILEAEGELAQAETAYMEAYRLNPSNPEPLFNAGIVNFKMRKEGVGAQIMSRVLLGHQNYVPALNRLGDYYFSHANYEKCVEYFQQVVNISPEAEAYNNMGACYYSMDKLNEAREMFKKALSLNPNLPDANKNLEQLNNDMAGK